MTKCKTKWSNEMLDSLLTLHDHRSYALYIERIRYCCESLNVWWHLEMWIQPPSWRKTCEQNGKWYAYDLTCQKFYWITNKTTLMALTALKSGHMNFSWQKVNENWILHILKFASVVYQISVTMSLVALGMRFIFATLTVSWPI